MLEYQFEAVFKVVYVIIRLYTEGKTSILYFDLCSVYKMFKKTKEEKYSNHYICIFLFRQSNITSTLISFSIVGCIFYTSENHLSSYGKIDQELRISGEAWYMHCWTHGSSMVLKYTEKQRSVSPPSVANHNQVHLVMTIQLSTAYAATFGG